MAKTNILLESGVNELEIVEFLIQNNSSGDFQSFAINVAKVREIIRMPKLSTMPGMPKCVKGIFNLRGNVISAFDLSSFLFKTDFVESTQKMIITEFNRIQVGFIVKEVNRIHRISWRDIIPPDTLDDFNPETSNITGILQFPDRHILMLDLERIVGEMAPNSIIDMEAKIDAFKGKPIAVTAEDSTVVRKMITSRLVQAGFDVHGFHNGEDAWNYMQEIAEKVRKGNKLNELVDIVITDVEMPAMDGYTLTRKIKETNELEGLPVVIFSSLITQDVLHKGQSVGANAQLSKPQISELLDTVRKVLGQS